MPSQTVHLTDSQFHYVLDTKTDSVSKRVRELVEKGMEAEEYE